MTRLIGGLLVVSLLYGPAKFQVKYIAYNHLVGVSGIEYAIKKEIKRGSGEFSTQIDADKTSEEDIEYAYAELDEGDGVIASLIKERNLIYSKIESRLDILSHLRYAMSEEQISGFTDFINCYNSESAFVNEKLKEMDERKAPEADLHNNVDIDLVFAELTEISKAQAEVVESIGRIIEAGNKTLQIL